MPLSDPVAIIVYCSKYTVFPFIGITTSLRVKPIQKNFKKLQELLVISLLAISLLGDALTKTTQKLIN